MTQASGQVSPWEGGRRSVRLVGFLVAVGLGIVLAIFVGSKAGGPHGDGVMVRTELLGTGDQVRATAPRGVLGHEYFTVHELQTAIYWDLAFILCYTAVLVVAAWLVLPLFRLRVLRTKGPAVAIGAAVAAGVLDLGEDVFLWCGASFKDPQGPEALYLLAASFAIAKFVILIGLGALVVAGFISGLLTPSWLFEALNRDSRGERDRPPPEPMPRVGDEPELEQTRGIALSGGGVRAASLSLGVLQEFHLEPAQEAELADPPHGLGWNVVDRVTAVSGGSYMAGAWQLSRNKRAGGTSDAWAASPDRKPGPEERHLLQNLGYLASTWPRGRKDEPAGPGEPPADRMAERVRNRASVWVTIGVGFAVNALVLVATFVLVEVPVVLLLDWLVSLDGTCSLTGDLGCAVREPRLWVPPVLWTAVGALASVAWLFVSKTQGPASGTRLLRFLKALTRGALVLGMALGVLLIGIPSLVAVVAKGQWWTGGLSLSALAGTLAAVVRIVRTRAPELAPKLGGVAFGVLLIAASAWFAVQIVRMEEAWLWNAPGGGDGQVSLALGVVAAVSLLVVLCAQLVGPELWSLFAFYRGKLRLAYGLHRTADGEAVAYVNDMDAASDGDEVGAAGRLAKEPDLEHLSGTGNPGLTICAASHATTRGVKTHYRIPAMSFTFGPDYVQTFEPDGDDGTYLRYAIPTSEFSAAYRGGGGATTTRITTMFAVALAGAAVAPVMGRLRAGPTSMLITFGNVRLGAWLPNPRYLWKSPTSDSAAAGNFPRVGLSYLYKEFLGVHDPAEAYVYVSDGGHWENTGVVEMLRPRIVDGARHADPPREIVCVDADPGSPGSVHQISQAIDLAKLECDVDVFMDLEPLRGFAKEPGGPVFAERSVNLGLMRRGSSWGLLWHCKPVLTRASPAPLLAHREIDAEFPHTSTVDQFFDTATYTAYRDLGRFNAAEIKKARDRLGRFLFEKTSAEVTNASDEEIGKYMWVAGAFMHLFHQISEEDERVRLLEDVRSALGAQVRATSSP